MTDEQMKQLINGLADEMVKRIYGIQANNADEISW